MTNRTDNFDAHTIKALKRLPRILAREGYTDAYTVYGPLNARADWWRGDLHLLPPSLQTLFKLFLLGMEVPAEELLKVFAEWEIEGLKRLSILLDGRSGLHTGELALIAAHGYLVFVQRPTINPTVYFGEDSAAFAAHLMPAAGDVCLDLCAGPATQSLICSGRASRVVAVEISPFAASHAELNIVMNDREDKIEVRVGNLYEAVGGMKFDYVSANPPLLPFPTELPYPFVGHGGADGLDVTRKILHGLPGVLKPEGFCQIIGSCLGDDEGPLCEKELTEFALQSSLKIQMIVPTAVSLEEPSDMFNGLAWTCAAAAGLPMEEVSDKFRRHLDGLGATHLDLFFLVVSNSAAPGFTITRHYKEHQGFWFLRR